MARHGLNCTLSYLRAGTQRAYRVRAGDIGHGVDMIYTESQARTQRAFYPHRAAEQQFALTILLMDWTERTHFTNWLADYASYAIDPDNSDATFPWMTCSVPDREFARRGVPLAGYQWGAHTGMMMFTPQIIFAAATTPGQKGQPNISSVINKWGAFASDPAIQYFYPIGTQLSGNQNGNSAQIQWPQNPSQFDQNPSTPVTPIPSPTAPGQTTTPVGVVP